jgi:hypothetical protein
MKYITALMTATRMVAAKTVRSLSDRASLIGPAPASIVINRNLSCVESQDVDEGSVHFNLGAN